MINICYFAQMLRQDRLLPLSYFTFTENES